MKKILLESLLTGAMLIGSSVIAQESERDREIRKLFSPSGKVENSKKSVVPGYSADSLSDVVSAQRTLLRMLGTYRHQNDKLKDINKAYGCTNFLMADFYQKQGDLNKAKQHFNTYVKNRSKFQLESLLGKAQERIKDLGNYDLDLKNAKTSDEKGLIELAYTNNCAKSQIHFRETGNEKFSEIYLTSLGKIKELKFSQIKTLVKSFYMGDKDLIGKSKESFSKDKESYSLINNFLEKNKESNRLTRARARMLGKKLEKIYEKMPSDMGRYSKEEVKQSMALLKDGFDSVKGYLAKNNLIQAYASMAKHLGVENDLDIENKMPACYDVKIKLNVNKSGIYKSEIYNVEK
ncbi:hypothetical protein KY321_01295 [Candidatus Woesearchaeota archaeon]|nr:hypothetical protein [Candidatus Woesearchaeota archaeon]